MNKRIVLNVCKYVLAFGLLGWVVYSNWAPAKGAGLRDVWQRHVLEGQPVHLEYLAAAFGIFSVGLMLTFLRWHLLVRAQGLSFRVADAIRLGLVGFFYNTFLPGSVGGDVVKAYAMAKEQSRRTVAVATVIMDRVIGLWGLFWFVAVLGSVFWMTGLLERPLLRDQATMAARAWALGATQAQSGQSIGVGTVPHLLGAAETVITAPEGLGTARSKVIVTTALLIVAFSVVVWLLLGLLPQHRAERFAGRLTRLPKIGGPAAEFWRAVWMYRCRQKSVAAALGIAWIGFVFFVLSFYFCAVALAGPVSLPSLTEHFLLVPIGLVIMAVPLFPGGAGIGELGFGYLYKWFGFAAAGGVLATLTQRIQSWIIGLIGYGVYLRMRAASRETTPGTPAPSVAPRLEHRLRAKPEPTSAN